MAIWAHRKWKNYRVVTINRLKRKEEKYRISNNDKLGGRGGGAGECIVIAKKEYSNDLGETLTDPTASKKSYWKIVDN